ncbi:MAG: DUF2799 domain-containing protein [Desulfobacteraceae bacterium]
MLSRNLLLGLILCFIACGCASLSKEECANANWDAIGYGDGSHGKSANRFNIHQKACAEHGYKASFADYKEGHLRGLREVFCKPRNGYQLGLKGSGYNNVCPSDAEPRFLAAYHHGRDIYLAQRSYNRLTLQLSRLKTERTKVDERIAHLRDAIRKDDLVNYSKIAQNLRNQRREITGLYDRIRNTRRKARKSKILQDHLRHASAAQDQLVERQATNLINKSQRVAEERQTIRSIIRLSIEEGQLRSQEDWIKSHPDFARPRRRNMPARHQAHRERLPDINQLKHDLYRRPFSPQIKRALAHCFEQAEYAGVLKHHREILHYLHDPHALNLLIDTHFDAEMENLNQRIDFASHHTPTKKEVIARKKRHRELHDTQRQREDILHQIADLENRIADMQQNIDQLKTASSY